MDLASNQVTKVAAHSIRDIAMDITLGTILNATAGHLTDPIPVLASLIGGALCDREAYTMIVAIVVAMASALFLPFTGSIHALETVGVVTAFLAFAICSQLAFRIKNLFSRAK